MYKELKRVNVIQQNRHVYLESLIIRYLGILAVMGAYSSCLEAPDSKSCLGGRLVKDWRKSEIV